MAVRLFSGFRFIILCCLAMAGAYLLFLISRSDVEIVESPEECTVYNAFYETIVQVNAGALSKQTLASVSGSEYELAAPDVFRKLSEDEEVIKVDTSRFFRPLTVLGTRDLGPCFEGRNVLWTRDLDSQPSDIEHKRRWELSRVGISGDGKYALLFTRYWCGNLCGYGRYYLLENKDEEWVVLGNHLIWVT